ncbi:MAG: hypothetical protein NWF01_06785 [Candidatus Bathyarchaeota archaeon]|nr:hypothetical protein [Candidatus Bathyarchaeota archaeon]
MESFRANLAEYRKQLQKGAVRTAYQGLMGFFDALHLHLKTVYPDFFLSDVHYGLMDYTYFYFFPKSLKQQNLKVAIVFSHGTFTFRVLLAGYNKTVQAKYWKLFKDNNWSLYPLAADTQKNDAITDFIVADNVDFSDLDALTCQVEKGTLKFIQDVEGFLAKIQS